MPDHYYTSVPQSAHKPARLSFVYRGHTLYFDTDSGVFSRLDIDKGTVLLLSALPENMKGPVLDIGCGYGVVGIAVAKAFPACNLILSDVNERAVQLARNNAKQNGVQVETVVSDGYQFLPTTSFSFILQNPPIRAGKKTIYPMFAQAARSLTPDGELWLVIRKQQGAPSAALYLSTLFANVHIPVKKGGYWIFRCTTPLFLEGDMIDAL